MTEDEYLQALIDKLDNKISFMIKRYQVLLHRNGLSFSTEKSLLIKHGSSINHINLFKIISIDLPELLLLYDIFSKNNDFYYSIINNCLNMSVVPVFSFKSLQDALSYILGYHISYDDAIGLCNGWDGSAGSGLSPIFVKASQFLSQKYIGKFNHKLEVKCH